MKANDSVHRLVRKSVFGFCGLFAALALATSAPAGTILDDFERPDGPPDGWTVYQGDWRIEGGQLTSTSVAGGTETDVWLGSPPIALQGDFELRAEVSFGAAPLDGVGNHGGFIFFASTPTWRYDTTAGNAINGYTVDWIDRAEDHGFRLIRIAGGVQTVLVPSTPEIVDPPATWTVAVEGDLIRVYADDDPTPVIEVIDTTYREGYFGAWIYQNGTTMSIDEMEVTSVSVDLFACFTLSADTGTTPFPVDFDASCTRSTAGVAAYEWDFGDGDVATGAQATHEYLVGGSYMVTLTVRDTGGNIGTATATVRVFDSATTFSDDFARSDGPVDNWTVFRGEWLIASEELTTTTAGAENWAWAGDPAFSFPANFTLTFRLEFRTTPLDAVGRHGGVMFCATKPTWRYDTTISGYTIDWIDRVADHGIRLLRVDNGVQTVLDVGARDVPDPPVDWQIVVEGEVINVFGDGVKYLEARDSTHRKGFFGVWGWSNGQMLAIDDVDVSSPEVNPCFTAEPDPVLEVGEEFTFDAGCSSASGTPITEYTWDFGDGSTGSGSVVTHAYATEGSRTVTLTLRTAGGLTASTERIVEAFVPRDSFADDFERPDGPPDGWTIRSGDWLLDGGGLRVQSPQTPESWIWAGDPAIRLGGITSIEFDMEFLVGRPADTAAPGRHAGAFFFAKTTQQRGAQNSGYGVDWIDRETDPTYQDLGYRLLRYDVGLGTVLANAKGDTEPGRSWRIEIDGDTIRLIVDGVEKISVVDATYRVGFFGFWSYFGDPATGYIVDVRFDDLAIGTGGPMKPLFHRGDADADGNINITDGIYILNYLFLGGDDPPCMEAANADDDQAISITDAIYVLNFLFLGGLAPPAPGPTESPCGPDPVDSTTDLGCESYTHC